ncbi:MAG TPA: two-component regulator propeller domain-containing protein, partial [Verrucomicrobiae bacterium]|nr:two-component regulator propeller domain-containing protein [Verrucomicrobiae bacterium]
GGLNHLRDGVFTHVTTTNGLTANFVTCLLKDRTGALWIGTSGGGLNRLQEGRLTAFTRRDGLASDFVRTLHEDAAGTLWIGTGGGLSILRNGHGRLHSVTRQQGLTDDVISQILEDDDGRLWFGSNRGIFQAGKEELQAAAEGRLALINPVSYGKAEGMESLECTGGFHPAGLKTPDGRLWFSTVKGLVMVEPKNLTINKLPPPVLIEELWMNGKAVPLPPATVTAVNPTGKNRASNAAFQLPLGPGVDRLEFRYTALSLVAPEKVRFRHKLEGLDRDWVEAGTRRTAYYTHLPVGDYRFQVMACNNDGVWNEAGQVLAFQVLPAFWQTWWFRAASILAALGSGAWLVRFISVRKLRGKLDRLRRRHALEKERARIAQDIHDDLGARLTQIALVGEIGQHHSDQPREVQTHFHTITRTAREAVQSMDAIVWAVNPRNDSLDNLANYISQFAQDFFQYTTIRCRLDIPAHLPNHLLSSETRHNLFLAVREALNNVARHSGASEVWVRLHADDHRLVLRIDDDGHGFVVPAAGLHGDGLVNMKRRIEEMGGDFAMTSSPGQGTRIRMEVPLGKPNAKPATAVHETNEP